MRLRGLRERAARFALVGDEEQKRRQAVEYLKQRDAELEQCLDVRLRALRKDVDAARASVDLVLGELWPRLEGMYGQSASELNDVREAIERLREQLGEAKDRD